MELTDDDDTTDSRLRLAGNGQFHDPVANLILGGLNHGIQAEQL